MLGNHTQSPWLVLRLTLLLLSFPPLPLLLLFLPPLPLMPLSLPPPPLLLLSLPPLPLMPSTWLHWIWLHSYIYHPSFLSPSIIYLPSSRQFQCQWIHPHTNSLEKVIASNSHLNCDDRMGELACKLARVVFGDKLSKCTTLGFMDLDRLPQRGSAFNKTKHTKEQVPFTYTSHSSYVSASMG